MKDKGPVEEGSVPLRTSPSAIQGRLLRFVYTADVVGQVNNDAGHSGTFCDARETEPGLSCWEVGEGRGWIKESWGDSTPHLVVWTPTGPERSFNRYHERSRQLRRIFKQRKRK